MPSSFRILAAAIPGPVVGILRQKRVLVESVDRSAHVGFGVLRCSQPDLPIDPFLLKHASEPSSVVDSRLGVVGEPRRGLQQDPVEKVGNVLAT